MAEVTTGRTGRSGRPVRPARVPAGVPARDLRRARGALEAGLLQNAAGHPVRASQRFRSALRLLGQVADDGPGRAGDGPTPGGARGVPGADPDTAYVRARALLGLVMSDFELRADVAASATALDEAERWARVAGASAVEVAVLGQRGLLAMRAGNPAAALRALDRAVARIGRAEPVDACVLLLNRGSLHLDAGRLAQARADLEECAARAGAAGDVMLLFKARHNLGYLAFLEGDLPAALAAMAEAAQIEHGGSPAVALLDRAQVLLEAGLTTDADRSLGRAAELFAGQGLSHDLAEVELARAHCALLARRPEAALRWARSARRRFVRRGNKPWSARAELAVCRARVAVLLMTEPRPVASLVRVGERAAALGARAGGGAPPGGVARAASVTAAEAFVAAGRVDRARAALDAAGRLGRHDPLSLTVQARVVRAQLAFAAGQDALARRHVRAGQAALALHRRQLGSVEAVVAAAVHGDRLTEVDVGAALRRGDAAAVLDAVERGRATFAGPARVRPPGDPVLAELLADLRRCLERERALPLDGGPAVRAEREASRREADRLRTLAREQAWRLGEGTTAPTAVRARDLRGAFERAGRSAGPTVVDYLVDRGVVHAVVVDPAGARLLHLADVTETDEVARRLAADLRVLANPLLPAPLREVAERSLARGLERLDALLVRPVGCTGPLHVVAGGWMVTLPWGLVPSRVGRPTSVGERLELSAGPPMAARDVVAFAGPDLPHAEAEARAVVEAWSGGTLLSGEDARCSAAATALRTARVVHLAAHGRHETDNPLFSWVRLADGPLFAHELDGRPLPATAVVLSACEVGRASARPGEQVLGLASVLLRLGASCVVAALAPLRDDLAARVMPALHERLAAGAGPAAALAAAASGVDEVVPVACFAPWAPLGAVGHVGHLGDTGLARPGG